MLLPYRVKVSDTKVTHFTPISALWKCLYRSHLRKLVSMKQTKHSRKSEAQNLCSKCPPFTRTHAFKRLRHRAVADGFGNSVQSWWQVGATQLHFLEPGVKVNSDYYRNTVLVNMLLLNIRSVFGDYYVFQQDGAPAHRARDTVTVQQSCQSLSLQRCGHLIRQIWIWWTTVSGVCFKRGSTARGFMMRVERTLKVERTSAEGVEAAGQCTPSSRQRLRSGIVVWMHVFAWMVDILNISFEPLTFCCVLFVSSILFALNVIDINTCKVLISCEMCYFCVWDFHTVWQQHKKCIARNFYANDFGILLRSYARKIMKIRQYF